MLGSWQTPTDGKLASWKRTRIGETVEGHTFRMNLMRGGFSDPAQIDALCSRAKAMKVVHDQFLRIVYGGMGRENLEGQPGNR